MQVRIKVQKENGLRVPMDMTKQVIRNMEQGNDILFDCCEIEHPSSTMIANYFAAVSHRAQKLGRKITVCNVREPLLEMLKLFGMNQIMDIHEGDIDASN